MANTAELIRKENEALEKAKKAHQAKIKKLEESEFKRIFKLLKQKHFFEIDFSETELSEGFDKMIDWKKKRDEAMSSTAQTVDSTASPTTAN